MTKRRKRTTSKQLLAALKALEGLARALGPWAPLVVAALQLVS